MKINVANPLFFGPKSYFTEYLLTPVIGRTRVHPCYRSRTNLTNYIKSVNSPVASAPLSPELRDRLMGKAPLRLIVKRLAVKVQPDSTNPNYIVTYWREVLECGHEQDAFSNDLRTSEPTAVRRRCPECLIAAVKKPNQSVVLPREKRRIA